MIRSLILVTGAAEIRPFSAILAAHNPDLAIHSATTLDELHHALAITGSGARLVTVLTGVIVPPDILGALTLSGYNFHPGPPAYPGKYPAAFSLYDGAGQFGATAHELAVAVDSGPIVGVEYAPVPEGADREWYVEHAYRLVMRLFLRLAPQLAMSEAPLSHLPVCWGTRRCSQRAVDNLLAQTHEADWAEQARRTRAFGHLLR